MYRLSPLLSFVKLSIICLLINGSSINTLPAINADSLYTLLKNKYKHLNAYEGKSIYINFKIKVRLMDTSNLNYLVRLVNTSKKNPEIYVAFNTIQVYLSNNQVTYKTYKKNKKTGKDSGLFRNHAHIRLNKRMDKDQNSSVKQYLFPLQFLPVLDQGFFNNKEYAPPSVLNHLHDTLVLVQKYKYPIDSYRYRKIYINNQLEIFKAEYFNNNINEPDEYYAFHFIQYENQSTTFDQLTHHYQFGKYSDSSLKYNPDPPKHDSLYQRNYLFFLGNDSLNLDSSKFDYFLLDYYYIGCYPCWQSIPGMRSIDSIINKDRITIIGIDKRDEEHEIMNFKHGKLLNYPQLDYYKKGSIFEINTYPTFILVDRHLKIIKIWVGYKKDFQLEIIAFLKQYDLLKS